ncbi:unnamed protein product [Cylindrotheca closterium]|uniref:Uncharacterized protein n=1 Tax=Cylindrotheca closterium TaxID=2856 RepID=A0AAD2FZ05_9STRA|nr:unnamed protein product [Cylindrotheca closterium]
MDRDKGRNRSDNRTSFRGHKSSSSSKHRQSNNRHTKSSRSSTTSGENKSQEKERTSRRSKIPTPGAHATGAEDSRLVRKSELKGSGPRPRSSFESGDDFSDASDGSFDPVAVANQRTAYYAQHQQQEQLRAPRSTDTLRGDPEAPSRGVSKKSSAGSTMLVPPIHSMPSSPYGSNEPNSPQSFVMIPSVGEDQQTVMAHEVVPLGFEGSNIRQLDGSKNVATMDIERMAEENRAFQARLQVENEIERQRLLEENNKIQREIQENFLRQQEEQEAAKAAKRRKQGQYMKILLCFLVLAAIGVGAYFGTRSSSSAPLPSQVSGNSDVSPTDVPETPSAPSSLPTLASNPSPAVTKAPADTSSYDPPNAQECANMEMGLPRSLNADDYLNTRQFDVIFSSKVSPAVSSSSSVSASLLSVLEQEMERLLRPELVGCSTIERRKLLDGNRQLSDFDFVIYDLEVSLAQDTESTCTTLIDDQSTQPCHVLVASMNVWLQGDEPNLLIRGHISEVLNRLDLPVKLELEGQFDTIIVEYVRDQLRAPDVFPTESPSPDPTPSPVEGPSDASDPTISQSISPTTAPVTGPSGTPPPISEPTPEPTPGPTPVQKPQPTPGSTPGPTPVPMPPPTPFPTPRPTPPPPPPQTDAPENTGSCDLSEHFRDGFYYEFGGGNNPKFTVDCSMFTGTRGLALIVDESTCNFNCVGRLKPSDAARYCNNQPPGTTVDLLVGVDSTGSKIYLGTDAYGKEQQSLDCDPPMIPS